jgi:hypothetical protein
VIWVFLIHFGAQFGCHDVDLIGKGFGKVSFHRWCLDMRAAALIRLDPDHKEGRNPIAEAGISTFTASEYQGREGELTGISLTKRSGMNGTAEKYQRRNYV